MSEIHPSLTLASASPRRRELLAYLGVTYQSLATDAEEEDNPVPQAIIGALPAVPVPYRYHPTLLAWRKANAIQLQRPNDVVLGADTIVVLDGDVLNKPLHAADAIAMLQRLSGRDHIVYTGLTVFVPGAAMPMLDVVASTVTLAALDLATIQAYVATGEPLDKAGAYGIQGLGGKLVRQVVGSYTNVVGLPLATVHRLLSAAGFDRLTNPTEAYHRWLDAQGKEALPCPPTLP